MATKSVATPQTAVPADRELFAINGRYKISPETTAYDMLNDVGCLLEASTSTIQAIIDGMSATDSQMAASASTDVPRMLFGVLYQLEMVRNLAIAAHESFLAKG